MLMKYRGRLGSRSELIARSSVRRPLGRSRRRAAIGRGLDPLGCRLDLDLPGLDFLRLGDAEGQHAVLERRRGGVALHADRQLELTVERAEAALAIEVLLPLY